VFNKLDEISRDVGFTKKKKMLGLKIRLLHLGTDNFKANTTRFLKTYSE
jgi:hypothetical protein